MLDRPLAVELDGRHTRGTTVIDWNRQVGGAGQRGDPDALRPGPFESLLEAALAAALMPV